MNVYICPKCKSLDVGYVFRFGNAFGIIPKMECKSCGNSLPVFPKLVEEKVNKLNKKGDKK